MENKARYNVLDDKIVIVVALPDKVRDRSLRRLRFHYYRYKITICRVIIAQRNLSTINKKATVILPKLRWFLGRSDRIRTYGILLPNGPIRAISAKNSFFRPFPPGKPRSSALLSPLFPSALKR